MTTTIHTPELDIDDDTREVPATGLSLEAQTRGEVDIQVATAKRYPRSVTAFIKEATSLATLDEDTAAACFYALPRDGKSVEGPSARFAEICASAWGNMRSQARIVGEDDRFITARGEAWDVQNNNAMGFEVRRRITNRKHEKYNDDMVSTTANAASSIALRNAVLKVIPAAFWRPIYLKCREVAVGKAETLANKRATMLAYFQKMGVTEERVLAALNVHGVEDIGLEQLATLRGTVTAIKEGDTSVDDAFPPVGVPMPQRKSENGNGTNGTASVGHDRSSAEARSREMPSAAAGTVGGPSAPPATGDLPAGADRIVSLEKRPMNAGGFWWQGQTARGMTVFTVTQTVGPQLEELRVSGALIVAPTGTPEAQGIRLKAVTKFPPNGA